MVVAPIGVVTGVVLWIDDFEVASDLKAQPQFADAAFDHVRAPDQDRHGQAFVDHRLGGAQHAPRFALGEDDAPRVLFGPVEQRLHQGARTEHVAVQALPVLLQVGNRPRGDAAVHGGLGDGRRDGRDQPGVERLGDQIFGPEAQVDLAIGMGNDFRAFGHGQVGDGLDAGGLHGFVDGGRPDIQGAPEDEREAEHVVDLVGIVRTPGGDDRIRARLLGDVGQDFRVRVGERQDQRPCRHALDHAGAQDAGCRKPQEYVGAVDDLVQRAGVGGLREGRLLFVHFLAAACVNHPQAVQQGDVPALQAQVQEQVQAGDAGGATAGGNHLDRSDVLFDDAQPVQQGRAGDDGGAVLVVVKDRDIHARPQPRLHLEALGRLDVFQVDGAEGGFQRGDDMGQLFRVGFVDFDVEDVDAGEFFEQDRLAFHHRFRRQGPDGAQSQHGGAVGHDADQIGADGQVGGLGRVGDDGVAGRRHAG